MSLLALKDSTLQPLHLIAGTADNDNIKNKCYILLPGSPKVCRQFSFLHNVPLFVLTYLL